MARPLRIEYPGAFYHITSRGNEKKDVFKSRRDRERFLHYLESATVRYGAVIHAYCLMDNHYHLMLETPVGNLSQIMQHINGAYTTYFNIKRKRAGHLFQGRFKAILVEADEYAAELTRYIHLNPVRARIVEQPEQYPWSSYRFFIGQILSPAWLRTDFVLGCFAKKTAEACKKYREFVEDLAGKDYESPLVKTYGSSILGTSDFVDGITTTYLEGKVDINVPALSQFTMRPSPELIQGKVKEVFVDNEKLARQASIYLCHKCSGMRLRELGERFDVRDTGITESSRRFAKKLVSDRTLLKQIETIMGTL